MNTHPLPSYAPRLTTHFGRLTRGSPLQTEQRIADLCYKYDIGALTARVLLILATREIESACNPAMSREVIDDGCSFPARYIGVAEAMKDNWASLDSLVQMLQSLPAALAFTLRRSNYAIVMDALLDGKGQYRSIAIKTWRNLGEIVGFNKCTLMAEEMRRREEGCSWHRCPLYRRPTVGVLYSCICGRVAYCGSFCQVE